LVHDDDDFSMVFLSIQLLIPLFKFIQALPSPFNFLFTFAYALSSQLFDPSLFSF
jgi:hypothetical protein